MILLLLLLSLLLLMLLLLHDQTLQGLMVLMLHLNLHHLRVRKKVLIESKKFFARAIYISLEIKMLPLSLGENFRRLSVVMKEIKIDKNCFALDVTAWCICEIPLLST